MKLKKLLKKIPHEAVYHKINSPVGELLLIASEIGLHALLWECYYEDEDLTALTQDPSHPIINMAQEQLKEYFAGERQQFTVPLAPQGTAFQQAAWEALCSIPYGRTLSYGEQAKKLGNINKCRAVGMANGANPISIIIPCHRVIGQKGNLVGFGGGVETKKYLLELELKYSHEVLEDILSLT